jgi:hypothetical protein
MKREANSDRRARVPQKRIAISRQVPSYPENSRDLKGPLFRRRRTIGWAMVSALYLREAASAHTDVLASETNRSDARRATGLILERRPNQRASVSYGDNNSIEAGNSSSCTIQISCEAVSLTVGACP